MNLELSAAGVVGNLYSFALKKSIFAHDESRIVAGHTGLGVVLMPRHNDKTPTKTLISVRCR
jgi:hypothetical protein